MTFLIIISGSLFLLYLAIILLATYKIRKPEEFQDGHKAVSISSYSVIIPFRDEIENLKMIYFDLTNLKFDQSRIEIIFIDDHSSDGSFEWLAGCNLPVNFKLMSSSKIGKKQALAKAISSAIGNYIITTDADCRLNPLWIRDIDETIESENPNLIVQPVITNFSNKLIYQFQYFDSLSLLGINMALYNFQGFPSLASGANLVFQKDIFDKIQPFRNNLQIASGDDMFLLRSFVNHNPNSIILKFNPENLVITKSESSWIGLFTQRMRWLGKMKRFNNTSSFALGLLSFAVQIILLELLFGLWYQNFFLFLFVFIWLVKSVIDYIFLRRIAQHIDQKVRWFNVFILEPVYMIFVPLIVVLSLFDSPKWKGRKIID